MAHELDVAAARHSRSPLAVPDQYATVRTNPITGKLNVLGVVGTKCEPVQNEESCALIDALTDESGATWKPPAPSGWARNLCDDAAAGVDDFRWQGRIQGPHRLLLGRAQLA